METGKKTNPPLNRWSEPPINDCTCSPGLLLDSVILYSWVDPALGKGVRQGVRRPPVGSSDKARVLKESGRWWSVWVISRIIYSGVLLKKPRQYFDNVSLRFYDFRGRCDGGSSWSKEPLLGPPPCDSMFDDSWTSGTSRNPRLLISVELAYMYFYTTRPFRRTESIWKLCETNSQLSGAHSSVEEQNLRQRL